MIRNWIYILILFSFTMCEYDIDIDIPFQKKLVILSNFNSEDRILVTVSTNEIIKDNSDFSIYPTDATVELFEDGKLIDIMPFKSDIGTDGAYISEKIAKEDVQYNIRVVYRDYPVAESSAIIPTNLKLNTKEFLGKKIQAPSGNDEFDLYLHTVEFDISLDQDSLLNRYFHLYLSKNLYFEEVDYSTNDTILVKYWEESLVSEDESIPVVKMRHEEGVLFTGNDLLLEEGILNLKTRYFLLRDEIESPVVFELRNVSEDYYRFHKTLGEQDVLGFRQNLISNQAIFVHNNIKNGIGNYSGYSITRDSIIIP